MKLYPGSCFHVAPVAALLLGVLLGGCSNDDPEKGTGQIALRVCQEDADGGVSADVSVSDAEGQPVDLAVANPTFLVEQSVNGGDWEPIQQVDADFQGPHRMDVMVVADNSGSQLEELELVREAIDAFARKLLVGSATDRVGLVRVSTVATVAQELTDDEATFDDALGDLFVTNGWTALWDGVRLANEQLAATPLPVEPAGGQARFCADRTHRAIVAFTDGRENNSADQHESRYGGDGIDTTFDDLTSLAINGIRTPVHWVGVGERADAAELEAMADATGARYVSVDHANGLHGALTSTAARLRSQVPICFELESCGHVDLRLTVEFDLDGERHSLTEPSWLSVDCSCKGHNVRCELSDG